MHDGATGVADDGLQLSLKLLCLKKKEKNKKNGKERRKEKA
jgi:hypothetical protein